MGEPIEVMQLGGVEVDDRDVPDAGAGKRLGDERSDAACADDPDVLAREILLYVLGPQAETVRGHPLVVGCRRGRAWGGRWA